MSSDGPTASWHPAMMPNSEADRIANLASTEPPAASEPPANSEPPRESTELLQADARPAETEMETTSALRPIDTSEAQNSSVDQWFPDYEAGSPWQAPGETAGQLKLAEDGAEQIESAPPASVEEPEPLPESETTPLQEETIPESEAVPAPPEQPESSSQEVLDEPGAAQELLQQPEPALLQEEPAAEPEVASTPPQPAQHEEGEHEQEGAQEAEVSPTSEHPPAPTASQEQQEAPKVSKHVSNDSFARTVSHQPIFSDDEDPEWDLPRAETDLFKFMPPNERTNSFPAVPQLENHEQHQFEALPTNQAEDIINELEHQSENLEFEDTSASQERNALQQDNFWGDSDDGEAGFPAQIGGDLQAAETEASDARYAEGLPLIEHQAGGQEKQSGAEARDPFAEDADGDDFFAQIGGDAGSSEQVAPVPGQLERKSTMQAINGLGSGHAADSHGFLDSTLEDDELLPEEPSPAHGPDFPAESLATAEAATTTEPPEVEGEDLAAKWSEAFADDDDDQFLLEDEPVTQGTDSKELDPSAFFVDDDEGFLEDNEEPASQPSQPPPSSTPAYTPQPSVSSKYLPTSAAQPATGQPSNPYFPAASPMIPQAQSLASTPQVAANPYAVQPSQAPAASPHGAPPAPRPAVNKAQSFADKAKGGYSSPYDLPMEVVKPRKRPSVQQLPRGATSAPPPGPPIPPPRTTSMPPVVQGPPGIVPPPLGPSQVKAAGSSVSPPVSNHSAQSPSLAKPPQTLSSKTGFFEELPSSNKTRPASRTSNKSQPSPQNAVFNGPPLATQPPPMSMPTPPQEASATGPSIHSDIARLVPPAPSNPYAALPPAANSAPSVIPPAASRYSPASSQGSLPNPNGAVPPPSWYSPAPPAQRAAGYGPASNVATPPTARPHLPRTSSPLAHFEARPAASQSEPTLQTSRSTSSLYEPKLNRMPSLPPTREVEEEDSTTQLPTGAPPPPTSQGPPASIRHNAPPPLESYSPNSMSPPKRKISYGGISGPSEIVPPPRSQTGSPGAMYGLRSPIKASEIGPRPSSAQGQVPVSIASTINPAPAPSASMRPRALSQKFNLIPPTDGREHDPLQRWKGVPLINWGVGGTLITSFPVDVPRYGMNQPGPMIVRSPGEIKVKTIKEVQPLEERLAKFPGPLRGKSKKKETVTWLSAGIEELEKSLPNLAFQTQLSHEDKRAVERVLLWKVLRIMVENDGVLEGTPVVDKSVRDVLSLTPPSTDEVTSPAYASGTTIGSFGVESSSTQMQPDSVDSGTVQRLKQALLAGDREKAVWDAADKRLWGHALLIANTVSPDLYHKVSQEFIKKEVNFPGHNNESLAALYSVLSGNHDESVDELVPVHARAGLQLIASSTGPASSSSLEGLEKWRETLTLILSNRSNGDAQALNSLGNLLSGYGRAEAAHICFLFARSATVFGGLDDPRAQFVLVGADHKTQSQQFFKETEALLLSEVYEYGLSLAGTPSLANGVPHLSVYKLQHAMTLAEHGYRDKALQYCDLILKDMAAQTKRSPYHHILLESAVEDLRQRMLQAPNKEASGSWISKPTMGKVSDSVWSRFNKFVAGDEDAPGQGSPKFGEESGPFAGLAGGTPTVSRPPSAGNATGMEMFGTPNGYPAAAPLMASNTSPVLTRTASRYAPASAQPSATTSPYEPSTSGRTSMERTSGEYNRSAYEPRPSSNRGGYAPNPMPASGQSYHDSALGIMQQSPYQPAASPYQPAASPYQPAPSTASTATSAITPAQSSGPKTPSFSPYTPFSQASSPYAPAASSASPYTPTAPAGDDQPPAANGQGYGFEPPSAEVEQDAPAPQAEEPTENNGYEPPSYGYEPPSYGYEPPSYQPDSQTNDDENDDEPKPKKKSFMDDDDDDFPSMASTKAAEKSKAEKDRENEELFRKAAEEDGESNADVMIKILRSLLLINI